MFYHHLGECVLSFPSIEQANPSRGITQNSACTRDLKNQGLLIHHQLTIIQTKWWDSANHFFVRFKKPGSIGIFAKISFKLLDRSTVNFSKKKMGGQEISLLFFNGGVRQNSQFETKSSPHLPRTHRHGKLGIDEADLKTLIFWPIWEDGVFFQLMESDWNPLTEMFGWSLYRPMWWSFKDEKLWINQKKQVREGPFWY